AGVGLPDVLTGVGPGGGPHVKAFSGKGGSLLQSFFAYDAAFTGGVRVGAEDVLGMPPVGSNGDGRAEILTAAGLNGGPHVKAFRGVLLEQIESFFAYDLLFQGGVYVG